MYNCYQQNLATSLAAEGAGQDSCPDLGAEFYLAEPESRAWRTVK